MVFSPFVYWDDAPQYLINFFLFIISHLLKQAELHSFARSDLDMWQAKINILPLWHRWQIVQHAQSSAVHNSEGGQNRTGLTQKEHSQSPPSCVARHNGETCLRAVPGSDMLYDWLTEKKYMNKTRTRERMKEGKQTMKQWQGQQLLAHFVWSLLYYQQAGMARCSFTFKEKGETNKNKRCNLNIRSGQIIISFDISLGWYATKIPFYQLVISIT